MEFSAALFSTLMKKIVQSVMDDSGTILYALGAQPFLQKRAASVLMTIK